VWCNKSVDWEYQVGMVEIKPYIEDDDGGEWIPLFPNTSMQSTEQSDSVAAVAAKNIIVDSSDVEGSTKSLPKTTVESEDDDDEGWQKLSTSRVISTEHQSQAVAAPTVSSLMDFIPSLSSITKVTTVIPTSDEMDDADSESDENIKWRRPDALDDTEIKDFRREREVSSIFEDYDDDKISSMKIDVNEDQQRSIPIKSDHIAKEEDNTSSSSSIGQELITIRKQQERGQTQQSSPRVQEQQYQQQQYQQRPPPSTRIKSKLQEKFIHDPLRSLPFHFLHNFFLEAKHQLTFAWKCYFLNNDNGENGSNETTLDTGALAAMILYFIVGLFAVGLIWSGIYDIGLVMLSTLISSMEASVKTSCDGMRTSIYKTLILGTVIWLMSRGKSREWFEVTFRFPTLSNVIPVVVAVTSPSIYEVFVIGFSIQVILSVCMAGLTGAGCPPGMPTVVVVVIAAAISVFLVMNMVCWSELENEVDNDSAEIKQPSPRNSFVGKQIHRVMTHSHECHALGIVTLAGLSIALIILRDGSSLRVLRIVLSIGTGIFVLERLWDSILEAIAIKSDRRAASGMSWRHISRRAVKQSLLDLSKSALWSKDDAGNVILGILSEEDSELRYAILGWILNRWSATSNDQPAEGWGTTATADDQSADDSSPLNEASSSPDEKKTSKSSHSESVPGARSGDEKVDMKDDNNDCDNTEEFRVHCESDFRNNDCRQPSNSSYQSLQSVITRLDADETLIPTIDRYSEWVYSLRPNPNVAFCVAMWKQCPAMFVFGVTFIWFVGRSFLQVILFYTLGSTSRGVIGNFECMCIIVGVLWPLLLIEYFLLSQWWKAHFKDREDIPDSVMILLESEDLSPQLFFYPIALATDSSALFLRVWHLLLESITFLESSVPAVRCATVAACTADLAADTLCLVDLALEVQRRGLVGGVGMLIWDAFNHHLKEELQQRRGNEEGVDTDTNQDEELDSKYTGAVINSARNLGKISQNIGGLMNSKKDVDGKQEKEASIKSDDNSKTGKSAEEISEGKDDRAQEVSNEERELGSTHDDDHDDEGVTKTEASSSQSEGNITGQEIKQPSQEAESGVKIEQKEDGKNLIPILVGGGLAVVGAFIGGVTVAAANKKNDEKQRSRDSDGS
jgi:hypothetical protein